MCKSRYKRDKTVYSTWPSKSLSEHFVTASFLPLFFLAVMDFLPPLAKKGIPLLLLLPGLSWKQRLEALAARLLILIEALILLSWDWSSSSNNFLEIGMWAEHMALYALSRQGLIKSQRCWNKLWSLWANSAIAPVLKAWSSSRIEVILEFFESASVAIILLAKPVKIAPTLVTAFWMSATWRSLRLAWLASLSQISEFTVGTTTLSQFDGRTYFLSFSLYFPSPSLP